MISSPRTARSILAVILLLIPCIAHAQQPVSISIFNEATAIPFTNFIDTPIHPGIQAGTDFEWKQGEHFRLYPSVSVGYMFHRKLFHGIYANLELGFDYKTSMGLNLKSKLGIGYLRTHSAQQEFQLKNGQYVSKRDRGNARVMPSLSLGLGYDLRRNDPRSPEVFIMYQSWIEYPYSPGFIPVMAHTSFHLGTRFYPSKSKE